MSHECCVRCIRVLGLWWIPHTSQMERFTVLSHSLSSRKKATEIDKNAHTHTLLASRDKWSWHIERESERVKDRPIMSIFMHFLSYSQFLIVLFQSCYFFLLSSTLSLYLSSTVGQCMYSVFLLGLCYSTHFITNIYKWNVHLKCKTRNKIHIWVINTNICFSYSKCNLPTQYSVHK